MNRDFDIKTSRLCKNKKKIVFFDSFNSLAHRLTDVLKGERTE